MLTARPDSTNDLALPCHEQRAGAATGSVYMYVSTTCFGCLCMVAKGVARKKFRVLEISEVLN